MIMQDNEKKPALRFKGFTDPWEQRKLGDITVELSEYATQELGLPLLTSSRSGLMYQDEYRDSRTTKSTETLFSVVPVGTCTYRHMSDDDVFHMNINTLEKGLVSREYPVFEASKGNNLEFLVQHINSSEEFKAFCAEQKKGGTRTRLYYNTLCQFTVRVPALKEQAQISQCLKKLDTLITLHQRKYEKLVNIKKSMLDKMFPQNGASVPEIRFKSFTDPWEQRKLSELTSMHARIGWQNLRTSEFLDSGDYMLITGTDFDDGTVNYSTCHFVERERYEQDKNIQIRNGSILITKDGTLGKVAYVQGLSMPATLNAGVFNVEIRNTSIVDERYLFQYLKAPFLMDYVDKKATGGTIKHLNQNILVDFPVVMPKKTEQVSIGNFFQRIDTLITLHQRKLEKLQNIKKSCLEKMFV